MTPEIYQAIPQQGGCVDLSGRAKFRLTGADRVRYLNGQVTNDVRRAAADTALQACVTDAKGRIEAEVFIHASQQGGGALWLDAEPAQRGTLAARLERYIVADDVELADVSDEWSLWHVFGHAAEALPGKAGTEGVLRVQRFGMPGTDVWLPKGSGIPAVSCPVLTEDDAETLRILHGTPRWPHELNGGVFPQEAGLEATAMDFAKGCYIGQEVLSRIKMTGKMPRRLVRFGVQGSGLQDADFAAASSFSLLTPHSTVPVGTVTSLTRHPVLDRVVGLAYVRQTFEGVDSLLLASGDPPRIFGNVEISSP